MKGPKIITKDGHIGYIVAHTNTNGRRCFGVMIPGILGLRWYGWGDFQRV